MDLINHIPGVGPSGAVNPGATTPAPYNVPQIGAVDGTGPGTATKNMAEIYNRDLLWRRALIASAGLAFDPTNWVQEVQAIQAIISSVGSQFCTAGGIADAITGDFTPDVITLAGQSRVYVRAAYANATTTPTFKADGTAAQTIVKGANQPLAAGDIAGAGFWMELVNDPAIAKWVLLNPVVTPAASAAEAQAFAVTTKYLSPSTLASAFGGGNVSKTANGYQKLPGGVILQWGTLNSSSGGPVSVVFPVTFPSICASLTVSAQINNGAGSGYATIASGQTASGFNGAVVGVTGPNNYVNGAVVNWMAMGY